MQTPGSSHKRCTGDEWARRAEAAVYQPRSGSLSGGLVLLGHTRGDTSPVADRDALVFRPGPDVRAALTAGRGPPGPAPLPRPPCGYAHEGRGFADGTHRRSLAQVNLILCGTGPEPHRLIHRGLRPQRVDGVPTVGLPRGPARRAGGEAAGLQDV